MSKLRDMWSAPGKLDKDLDKVEAAVDAELCPKPRSGRVTPFFQTERLRFDYFDYTEKSFPLVQSAGRVTRVTRLSYSVSLNISAPSGSVVAATFQAMRPTPRGMVMANSGGAGDPNETVFLFESPAEGARSVTRRMTGSCSSATRIRSFSRPTSFSLSK